MNKIVYRIYADSNQSTGPEASQVGSQAENVVQALQQFPIEVETLLRDFEANVSCESPTKEVNSVIAVIESAASEEQVGAAVAASLSRLNLNGDRLQRV